VKPGISSPAAQFSPQIPAQSRACESVTVTGASHPPRLLTWAGFDPTGGAGILADLKTFAAFGCRGAACISAITVQSYSGVTGIETLSADSARQTVNSLLREGSCAALKIGMLGSAEMVGAVVSLLGNRAEENKKFPANAEFAVDDPANTVGERITIYIDTAVPVILDPVMASSSGFPLLDAPGVERLKCDLLPLVDWLTPNTVELAQLLGRDSKSLDSSRTAIEQAARDLQSLAAVGGRPRLNLVVTGGHLETPDDFLLTATGEAHWLSGEWVGNRQQNWHGTGCAFSSALAASLALGQDALAAVTAAKAFVAGAIRHGIAHAGASGELNHHWQR